MSEFGEQIGLAQSVNLADLGSPMQTLAPSTEGLRKVSSLDTRNSDHELDHVAHSKWRAPSNPLFL